MTRTASNTPDARNLGSAARSSLMWAGGITLLRDVVQFATMLVLVRLLTPADYGSVALAQAIVGLLAVFSSGTFVLHALQLRDSDKVDWQAHFTAAAVLNTALFCAALAIAWGLSASQRYHTAALPLAGLATVLLVDIAGTLRHRMLETRHDWKRFRLLLILGTGLGSAAGLAVAMAGGGVWALVIQVPLFGVPAAIDLFWHGRWRPQLSWSWSRHRAALGFGCNRIAAAALVRGRLGAEQFVLAGAYDVAALGIFTRSVGLATLLAGRLGAVATAAVYPVITRSEPGSAAFRRHAALVLRGVSWATVAAAGALALTAADTAALLYGDGWSAVVPLLPLAAAGAGFIGIANAANRLLLATGAVCSCLGLDTVSALTGVGLALLIVPLGIGVYLAALALHGAFVLALSLGLLWARHGISVRDIATALAPAAVAVAVAAGIVIALRAGFGSSDIPALRLGLELALFAVGYLAVLRVGFEHPLGELLQAAPGGARLKRLLGPMPRASATTVRAVPAGRTCRPFRLAVDPPADP